MDDLSEAQARIDSAKRALGREEAELRCVYLRNCGWVIVRSGHTADSYLAESPYTKQLHDLKDAERIEKLRRKG